MFAALHVALSTFMPEQASLTILIPAILLAGLAGGFLTAFLTLLFCLAGLGALSLWGAPPWLPVPPAGTTPITGFVLAGSICGLVGAALRHSIYTLHQTRNRLQTEIYEQHSASTRQTADALSQTRQDFYSVADSVPVMLWLSDANNTIRFVNRAYFDFAGKSASQMTGDEWKDLVHPDDYTATVDSFKHNIQSGQPFELLARYRRHDGQYRWVRSILQPRYGRDGVQQGIIGTAFDVTEAEAAAARVQESEARFRTIADSAPAIIWMVDAHGNTEFGNRRFRSIFNGKPPLHLISAMRDMTAPEDLPAFDKSIQDALRAQRRFSYLGPIHHPAYGHRWLHTEAAPRYDLQGRLTGFTGVSIDVTESQRAERELKRSN